jgi:hypothetical protein
VTYGRPVYKEAFKKVWLMMPACIYYGFYVSSIKRKSELEIITSSDKKWSIIN